MEFLSKFVTLLLMFILFVVVSVLPSMALAWGSVKILSTDYSKPDTINNYNNYYR